MLLLNSKKMSFSRCIGIAIDEETAPRKQRLFVAAIDFGTAYSGYAFSSKAEPLKIHTNVWNANHLQSAKAPTTLLLSPEGEFQAFGYDAETKYTEMMSEKKKDDLCPYYFHCFKMILQCENVSQ